VSTSTLLFGSAGLLFLVFGGELLVRGASRVAESVGLSPLIVGLTVVAFGTSAPELAVSVQASLAGQADLALGNVVGSNIFNVLFILGLSALIIPLAVQVRLVQREIPLMIGTGVALLLLAVDGGIGRLEGVLLLAGLLGYTAWSVLEGRRASRDAADEPLRDRSSAGSTGDGRRWRGTLTSIAAIVGGLALLVVGARWLVHAAVEGARTLGVDELTIGVTVVAAGTSLPEVATSLVAAVRGQRDIAVGNVVGSNLFNVLGILGAAAVLSPEGIAVADAALRFDIPVMIAVSLACLPIFFTGWSIRRWEGALLLGYYVAYVAYVLLAQQAHAVLPALSRTMWLFVLPVTAVVLAVAGIRSTRSGPGTDRAFDHDGRNG
jgi:cation:H+ antiporter